MHCALVAFLAEAARIIRRWLLCAERGNNLFCRDVTHVGLLQDLLVIDIELYFLVVRGLLLLLNSCLDGC